MNAGVYLRWAGRHYSAFLSAVSGRLRMLSGVAWKPKRRRQLSCWLRILTALHKATFGWAKMTVQQQGFYLLLNLKTLLISFFAQPDCSVRGWESAADAQARICAVMNEIIAESAKAQHKTVVICGHGATGTLLYCALAGVPISRHYDQSSQGHYWCYDTVRKQMLHHWRNIAEFT
ncbi:histidine phosphatase family protein [Pseudochrobactrum kiredjianiae]|uniref:Histidine phosphatase family protein n=1 Tax=Pseudochrobactrum kiredjianiae TaxID=386305 RepID=A0ABW3V8J4_9HYPH|nr:histidine phosphatase family protein [Pseudochrobactrum kiredjianiae]MDM7850345.1 histidine phosphatase family protein [Pseudochrobactrum kiredjianiae]